MATYTELYIDQGSDFNFTVSLDGVNDLTGYITSGEVKVCEFDSNPIIPAIAINNTDIELTILLTAAQTQTMTGDRYSFTVEVTSPSNVKTRVIEGIMLISRSVIL